MLFAELAVILCRNNPFPVKQFIGSSRPQSRQYLIVTVLILLVSAACYLLSAFMGYKVTAFVLLVTVSIAAMLFDIFPVLLAALLSALIWDYFFIPPHFTFHIGSAEDSIMLLMYFVIASVNGVLTYKIRQLSKVAREEEEKANAVKLYNILLNSLSHELRTPISTIIGASDNLLSDKNKLSETNRRELVQEISEASLRLNKQVENLLNMSRLESGFIQSKKDWCDVHELVHSVVNQLEEVLKKHTIKVNFEEHLPLFRVDFGLMQQVLNNLLSNAAAYTPAGSSILIHTGIRKNGERESLLITVEDNGPGFPEDEIGKVFEKFYRLKNSRTGGTGLGLSIVRGFVEAQGGTVSLHNSPKGGARFVVEIESETNYLNNQGNE
jgi:two-component system sensor histidine kinase KdpD